jgi:DNA-directed RNA polymerase subunit RPC12/RpoP
MDGQPTSEPPLRKARAAQANGVFEHCPYCSLLFRPIRLKRHLILTHPAMLGLKKPPPPATQPATTGPTKHTPEVVHCIRCGADVPQQHFDAHFFTHTTFAAPASASAATSSKPVLRKPTLRSAKVPIRKSIVRQDMVQCPYCPANVKVKNIARHCQRVHGRAAAPALGLDTPSNRQPTTNSVKPSSRKKSRDGFRRVCDPKEKTEGQMDATHGYSVFREAGRFGSHPLHDDFSDEGSA